MAGIISSSSLGGVNLCGMILFFSYNIGTGEHGGRTLIEDDTWLYSIAVAIFIPIVLLTVLITVLCIFHIRIVFSGETTKEKLL